MAAGCAKVYREKISGAKTDRAELAKVVKRREFIALIGGGQFGPWQPARSSRGCR